MIQEDSLKSALTGAFADVAKPTLESVYNTLDSELDVWRIKLDATHCGLAGKDWWRVEYRQAIGVRPDVLRPAVYRYYIQSQTLPDFGLGGPGIGPLDAGLTRAETAAQSDLVIERAKYTGGIDPSTKLGRELSEALTAVSTDGLTPAAYIRQCRFGESTYPLYFLDFEGIFSDAQLNALSLYVRFYAERGEEESIFAYEDYWARFSGDR